MISYVTSHVYRRDQKLDHKCGYEFETSGCVQGYHVYQNKYTVRSKQTEMTKTLKNV